MRSWLCVLGLGALLAACAGTEGTLVVTPAGAAGNGASGAAGSGAVAPLPYIPAESEPWQAKLSGAVDIDEDARLFYLDAELQDTDDLSRLHAEGRHYLCYFSAGSWEDFRDDQAEFPEEVLGSTLSDFPNERWLDVRAPAVRGLMVQRIERLAALGCDGIPPSSLAVHRAETGFALTQEDALAYARWLAERIHAAGMSAGLSGPTELTGELWPTFDFGLAIGCLATTQCSEFAPLERAGKPVLHIELGDAEAAQSICKQAEQWGFSPLVTDARFSGLSVRCQDIL